MKILENFFVGLGVKTDQTSFQKAQGSFLALTQNIGLAVTAIKGLQMAFGGAIMAVANSLNELDISAKRIGSTAAELDKLRYAARMVNMDAQDLQDTLQTFTGILGEVTGDAESNPAKMFAKLGIEAKNANGEIRDTSEVLLELGKKISTMSKAEQMMVGQQIGIDEGERAKTMLLITGDLDQVIAEYDMMAKISGQSLDKMAQDANDFTKELERFKTFTGMLSRAITADFIVKLRDQFKALRLWLMDNAEIIKRVVTSVMLVINTAGNLISGVFRAVGNAISVLIKKWDALDSESKAITAAILGAAVAFKVLNKAMLANPIYRTIAAIAGLLLLLDDFQTYTRGGKSLIDWGPYEKDIQNVIDSIGSVFNAFMKLAKYVKNNTDFSTGIGYVVKHFAFMAKQLVSWINVIGAVFRGDLPAAVGFFGEVIKAGLEKFKNIALAVIDLITWIAKLLGVDISGAANKAKEFVVGAFDVMSRAVGWLIDKLKIVADWLGKTIGKGLEFLGIKNKIDNTSENPVDIENEQAEKEVSNAKGNKNKQKAYGNYRQRLINQGRQNEAYALDSKRKQNKQVVLSAQDELDANLTGQNAKRKGGINKANIEPENVNVQSPALVTPGGRAAAQAVNQTTNNRQENNIKVENTFNIQATDPQGTASEVERTQGEVSRSMVGVVAPFPAKP